MTNRTSLLLLILGTMLPVAPIPGAKPEAPMRVVPSVDLTRYAGKWYEIARLPNRFQRDCASDKEPNSKLKVSFFWPFHGNYWIIDLDPDYKWAVVGEPGRKYLWVLSREPRLDDTLYEKILDRAKQQGYDVGPMIKTKQT